MANPPRPSDRDARSTPSSLIVAGRPYPPQAHIGGFRPAPELAEWALRTFVAPNGPLANPHHEHLADADIACLWTDVDNSRQQRTVLATAELMPPGGSMGKWVKARMAQQIEEWFGTMPDFLITVSTLPALNMDDAAFCALVEHELYHCAFELDEFGSMKRRRDSGLPVWAMRGHDVEEFAGVVERYGLPSTAAACLEGAIKRGPTIARADIAGACGTCLRMVA